MIRTLLLKAASGVLLVATLIFGLATLYSTYHIFHYQTVVEPWIALGGTIAFAGLAWGSYEFHTLIKHNRQ